LTLALMAFACFGAASHAASAGAKFYQELLEQDGLYPDEAWQAYVDAIGQRLLAVTPDAGKEYHFYVLDST
jgi:predicted Zn-dependent protease